MVCLENKLWVADGILDCIDGFVAHLNEQKSTAENENGSRRVCPGCFVSLSSSLYVSQDLADVNDCFYDLDDRGANLNIKLWSLLLGDSRAVFRKPVLYAP